MEETPADRFPNLVEVLGLSGRANTGEVIRPTLKEILEEIEAAEEESRASLVNPKAEGDQPFARPARILLGLTPRSEHKKPGERRALALPIRGVRTPSTMRKHQKKIVEELANYLWSRYIEPEVEIPGFPTYRGLSELNIAEWEVILKQLDLDDLQRLTIELAKSYQLVADAIADSQLRDPAAPPWRSYFFALQLLCEREFKDQEEFIPLLLQRLAPERRIPSFRITFFRRFCTTVVLKEKTHQSRYALVVQILDLIVHQLLPSFSEAERHDLEVLARWSGGQRPVFHAMLAGNTDLPFEITHGPRILHAWCELTAIRVDTGDTGLSRYEAIERGFSFIWELLYPDKSNRINMKALNQYLDTDGGTDPARPYRNQIVQDAMNADLMKLRRRPVRDYLHRRNLLKEN